jgi:predicted PolB exonuclease-like 3'-5' exonuclease
MLPYPKTKLLFFDLETVGEFPTLSELEKNKPGMYNVFMKYQDWFHKRFPEDSSKTPEEVYISRSGLIPEFAKIVVASFAFINQKGEMQTQTYAMDDEKELLRNVIKLLNKIQKLDFVLCGHNIKGFDIPMLYKRMVINGFQPARILPTSETKPWEVKALDTKEFWNGINQFSIAQLELISVAMGCESSKGGEVTGNIVHSSYWDAGILDKISEYCQQDVRVLVDLINKFDTLEYVQ